MAAQDPDEYEDAMLRFLAVIPPEKRLAGLTPEQVLLALAALPPEERLLFMLPALPDDMVRALDHVATLPESIRAAINKRLGR